MAASVLAICAAFAAEKLAAIVLIERPDSDFLKLMAPIEAASSAFCVCPADREGLS